ncbi:MAG: ribosome assembly RNA-binding protein YhbY [Clostridiales bacterium]|nr:ribosome assembly RNA-binding protein YhbY [Clostridiales bacterium]
MLTSKQRTVLKGLASNIDPIGQIGKGGISENQVQSFDQALEKRELIKITVLENSMEDKRELARELEKVLNAECVIVIGRKIVLYRKSNRKDINHIEI